jgi:regulation of enolase protein 1 (concanavalin A-like superfamily)
MRRYLCAVVGGAMLSGLAAAAEPRVVFEDRFEGKVGEGWSWLRENLDAWRIKEGALEIRVEPGVAPTVKNALVRKAPDRSKGKFAIEVTITLTADPTRQYEQAGITWYRDKNPVFKLVHEFIDGKTYIIPGRIPTATKTIQLRLVVTADRFTAQFRPDGKGEFRTAAEGPLPAGRDEQVSLQCYNGPPDAEHWIRFDDFRIVELAE